jgi:hypothetical protein
MSNLFVGKNNIFGRYAQSMGNVCVSHIEIENVDLNKYDRIILSAFSPTNKQGITDDKLIEYIIEFGYRGDITYISTMRVGSNEKRYQHYSVSKLRQEKLLINRFKHKVSIKRFPVVLADTPSTDISGFALHLKTGLKNGEVVFDVSLDSSWYFVFIDDVFARLFVPGNECIISPYPVKVSDLKEFLSAMVNVRLEAPGNYSVFPEAVGFRNYNSNKHATKLMIIERMVNAIS